MRLSYLQRQLAAMRDPRCQLRPGSVSHCCVRHDDWCSLLKRVGPCTCNPHMLLLLDDGRRYEIRRDGSLRKPRKWLVCSHGFDQRYNRHFVN